METLNAETRAELRRLVDLRRREAQASPVRFVPPRPTTILERDARGRIAKVAVAKRVPLFKENGQFAGSTPKYTNELIRRRVRRRIAREHMRRKRAALRKAAA